VSSSLIFAVVDCQIHDLPVPADSLAPPARAGVAIRWSKIIMMRWSVSDLPENWVLAPIGSLCTLFNGRAFKPSDWKDKGLPIVRIQNLNNPKASYNYFDKEVDDRFLLNGGELLFAWSGTPGTSFGAHVWHGGKAVLNQHIFRVDFDETLIDKRFFRYAINQKLNELIGVAHGGVGLRHVTKGVFENTEIVVPPFDEQKRIAEKLDSLLARVDSCQTHLERVPQILKRFRQSVLAAATSGRLTEDWREENAVIGNWRLVNLREVATGSNYGTSAKSQKSGKMPVLRMGNIQDGKLDWTDLVFTSDKDEIEKYKLVKGDVLFNRTNSPEWVGKTAVYKGEQPAIYAGYLIRVKCGDELLPDFINYCLNSPMGRDWRWQVKSDGVSQSNINAQKLADFEFELPPLEEQTEIVRRVEKLFAYAERLEARYTSASQHVERLTPSLLAKAFRGELVEQEG
jgi:type I restriction enzyme S subunit